MVMFDARQVFRQRFAACAGTFGFGDSGFGRVPGKVGKFFFQCAEVFTMRFLKQVFLNAGQDFTLGAIRTRRNKLSSNTSAWILRSFGLNGCSIFIGLIKQ